MAAKIEWSKEMDEKLLKLHSLGYTAQQKEKSLTKEFNMASATINRRLFFLNAVKLHKTEKTKQEEHFVRFAEDSIIPAGHNITWRAITVGTLLDGVEYGR